MRKLAVKKLYTFIFVFYFKLLEARCKDFLHSDQEKNALFLNSGWKYPQM